jgi:hypothetical protein
MSENVKSVNKWRNITKQRMIDSFGGKCGICGYDNCPQALEFHHLNPHEKEITLSKMTAGPKKWKTIVNELRKCVMVCSNCHREIHFSDLKIPNNIQRYNEEYTDYKEKQKEQYYDKCPICGGKKRKNNKTCSLSCAATKKGKIQYPDYSILLEMVKKNGYCGTGRILGVSDVAIRKRIKKLEKKDN